MNAPSYIVTDGNLIPTGEIASVARTALDFNKSRKIGSLLNRTEGLCGTGCIGYASLFLSLELLTLLYLWFDL
jgi:aldose 1-epimerase